MNTCCALCKADGGRPGKDVKMYSEKNYLHIGLFPPKPIAALQKALIK